MAESGRAGLGGRAFLGGAAVALGGLVAKGLGVSDLGAGDSDAYETALRALGQSLTARQRELVVFPVDHPTRQIVNSQSVLERPHLGTLFSPSQRALVEVLYRSMLSSEGIASFAPTIAVEGRFDGCILAIYGEPESGRAHSVIQGGHLMLRGGQQDDAQPFGGGISYGHQTGNGLWRVAGNSFASHGDAANRFMGTLTRDEQSAAILPQVPHELILQAQDEGGSFHGVRIGSVGASARDAAHQLLETVLAPYPESARTAAMACIAANGGVDDLRFATYASHGFYEDMMAWGALDANERQRRGDPYWQVWRLEGPGTIVHFKGYPHVHAYIQVARDPARANLGTSLATTEATIEGERMRSLLEAAVRRASGEALAFYGHEIPGRFCAGEITTGLAYTLDPYRNRIAVATIRGDAMAAPLRDHLLASGVHVDDATRYRVASNDFTARHEERFGVAEDVEVSNVLLRDALVEQIRTDGLRAAG